MVVLRVQKCVVPQKKKKKNQKLLELVITAKIIVKFINEFRVDFVVFRNYFVNTISRVQYISMYYYFLFILYTYMLILYTLKRFFNFCINSLN